MPRVMRILANILTLFVFLAATVDFVYYLRELDQLMKLAPPDAVSAEQVYVNKVLAFFFLFGTIVLMLVCFMVPYSFAVDDHFFLLFFIIYASIFTVLNIIKEIYEVELVEHKYEYDRDTFLIICFLLVCILVVVINYVHFDREELIN